jgi:hypothetical protein
MPSVQFRHLDSPNRDSSLYNNVALDRRRITREENPHPQNSEGQINDLHELVAVDYAFTPDGVEIGKGLFRDSGRQGR